MTPPTPAPRRILIDSLPAIVTSLVISTMGGAGGMFLGYQLLSYRMDQAEIKEADDVAEINRRLDTYEDRQRDLGDAVGKMAADVGYIRGRMEATE